MVGPGGPVRLVLQSSAIIEPARNSSAFEAMDSVGAAGFMSVAHAEGREVGDFHIMKIMFFSLTAQCGRLD
jgi:hypothetical protein